MTQAVIEAQHAHWAEHPDYALPAGLLEIAEGADISPELTRIRVSLTAREFPSGAEHHFRSHLGNSLGEVFREAAEALQKPLLPPAPIAPLDLLYVRRHGGTWEVPVHDLEMPLWVALAEGFTRHVAIEYRRVIRINTKWGVASSAQMTPLALLNEFGFSPDEFTLYRANENQALPPEIPIHLHRGQHFEAQKDGKYGGAICPSTPARGLQTIEDDVAVLRHADMDIVLHDLNSQKYVEVRSLRIPSPPWSTASATILIAVPGSYPQGGLDALYLLHGISQSGSVPRGQAPTGLLGRTWTLISWHYASNRPWNPGHDDLGTHIEHCRGYFLARGVTQ